MKVPPELFPQQGAQAAFFALCAKHGVDPNSVPDAPGRRVPKPRQRPRSPDRKASRDRRRMLGASSVMPPNLRQHYTEGQRAVLCIVAGEVKHHGICDLPIDKIAALAGVGRTTVQTTMHLAKAIGHVAITYRPQRGRKSLPNVVEITSAEWMLWIKCGPGAHRPDTGSKKENTTKIILKDGKERDVREAIELASEIGKIAGYTDASLPPWWSNPQSAVLVDGWRRDLQAVGIGPHWLPPLCRWVVSRRQEREPPRSIAYFAPEVRRMIDRQRRAMQRYQRAA